MESGETRHFALGDEVKAILGEADRPLSAAEVAARATERVAYPISKSDASRCLHGRLLKGLVEQDAGFRWYLVSRKEIVLEAARASADLERRRSKSIERGPRWERLNKLISYYLECIRADESDGAREFLTNEDKRFIRLPMDEEWSLAGGTTIELDLAASDPAFLDQLRKARATGALLYGYPSYVDWKAKSKTTGWTGGFLVPVFLQSVEYELDGSILTMRLGDDLPRANPEFARVAFASYEERRVFAEEVGLIGDADSAPESGLSDLAARMGQVGAPAELVEELDPAHLATEPSISQVRKGGIYNRAAIVLGEHSKYTQGLEAELEKIRDRVTDEELDASALSVLFAPVSTGDNRRHDSDPGQLVKAVPLNDEQRRAAESAFSEKLTVVTGPPGTGKSQVVLTVLANAYIRGHSVLFTSRNHKAVNVVEDRLNALAGFPLVIRTGKRSGDRDLYAELLAFINQLLSITPNDADISDEQSIRRRLAKLGASETETWEKLSALRRLRNEMDSLDRELQEHREEYPKSTWLAVCDGTLNSQLAIVPDPDELRNLAGKYLRPTGLLETVGCWFSRKRTYRRLAESANLFCQFEEAIGPPPSGEAGAENLPVFVEYFGRASELKAVSQIGAQYRQALVELRAAGSVEALADELAAIHDKTWTNGARLLAAYSKLLPNRITPDLRKTLGQYRALLERLNGDNVRGFAYLGLLQEQRRLFQQVMDVLPTWCVTNLSAKSSLPFAAGMFDLLVIDEASQCDIPSAIPLLFRAKRAVIIGDPQQLRHVTTIDKARDNQLQSKHGLISAEDVAFAFSINSLYDLASMSVGGGQVVLTCPHCVVHFL